MRKGEIYLVEIPPASGHEQGGLRPVIIFSGEVAGIVSVIPFTTNASALKFPFTLKINNSNLNGLKS